MRDPLEVWRERPWIWGVPLALVVLGVLLVIFFQSAFAGRVAQLETRYQSQGEYLEELQAESRKAENFLESTSAQADAAEMLYLEYFGLEAERFTEILREVRALARRAGLDPKAFAYPENELDDADLVRRSINFGVEGRYEDVRKFINLLESTESFVTLEQVALGGVEGSSSRLSVTLSISTVFAKEEALDEVATTAASGNETGVS